MGVSPLAFALHLPKQFFEPAGEAGHVTQGAGFELSAQAFLDGHKALAILGEGDGAPHIVIWRLADQLRRSRRCHDAGAETRCEAFAGEGQDRQAHIDGVGRGGMRTVGEGIEKEIGNSDAGKMLRIAGLGRKQQPSWINAAPGCRIAQTLIDLFVAGQQPEHAAGCRLQDGHPAGKAALRNLLHAVEAGKDKGVFG